MTQPEKKTKLPKHLLPESTPKSLELEWRRRTAETTKRGDFDAIAIEMLHRLDRQRRHRGRSLKDVQPKLEAFIHECPDPSSAACVWRDRHDTMREEWKAQNGMRSEVDPVEWLEKSLELHREMDERLTVLRKLLKG